MFRVGRGTRFATWVSHSKEGLELTLDNLEQRLGIASRYRRLFGRLLEIVQEEGWLAGRAGRWRVVKVPGVPGSLEHLEQLRKRFPAAESELELLGRSAGALTDVLRRGVRSVRAALPLR